MNATDLHPQMAKRLEEMWIPGHVFTALEMQELRDGGTLIVIRNESVNYLVIRIYVVTRDGILMP